MSPCFFGGETCQLPNKQTCSSSIGGDGTPEKVIYDHTLVSFSNGIFQSHQVFRSQAWFLERHQSFNGATSIHHLFGTPKVLGPKSVHPEVVITSSIMGANIMSLGFSRGDGILPAPVMWRLLFHKP